MCLRLCQPTYVSDAWGCLRAPSALQQNDVCIIINMLVMECEIVWPVSNSMVNFVFTYSPMNRGAFMTLFGVHKHPNIFQHEWLKIHTHTHTPIGKVLTIISYLVIHIC